MRISDLIKMGLRNLTRRKARTFLTVSGVVIGSLSIIIMISIGKGVEKNFDSQLIERGSLTTITVNTYGDIYDEEGNWVDMKQQKLDDRFVEQLKTIDHVKAVSPVISKNVRLETRKYVGYAYITAMDRELFEEFEFPELEYGEYPSEEDNTQIIFGYGEPSYFYDPNAMGMSWQPIDVDIEREKLILKFDEYPTNDRKKEFSLPLNNISKMVETKAEFDWGSYMDLDYFKEIYLKYANTLSLEDRKKAIQSLDNYQQVQLNVDSIENVEEVQEAIKNMGFSSYSNMQFVKPLLESSQSLQMVLLVLGAVAMIVASISIANTMVMSIYERTKEIGIMKVLGSEVRDVKRLFLFEAGMIGFLGGVFGNVLGFFASWLINKYGEPIFGALMGGQQFYETAEAITYSVIPPYLPFLAIGISVVVGLISGYFPARRATRISAIEAMRSEG